MSVLLEFAIFPFDAGGSVCAQVSQVIDLIRKSGFDYQLTAMGTLIETDEVDQALALVSGPANCRIASAASASMRRSNWISAQVNGGDCKARSIRSRRGSVK